MIVRHRCLPWALALACSLGPSVTRSQDPAPRAPLADATAWSLADAYQAARGHDALYLAATKELEAARQGVPIARAALLPQVGLGASWSKVTGNREYGNAPNEPLRVPLSYEAPQVSLNLRAPLFDHEAQSRFRQASFLADGAEALMAARHLDLIGRLTAAYLQVLVQFELVVAATEEARALEAQAQSARQRHARGEGTLQESATSEAAAGLARARLVQSRDDLAVARRRLQRITGIEVTALRAAPADFLGLDLPLPSLQAWLDQALAHSPSLRYRSLMIDVATQGIERRRAGHLPRLDVVASVARAENESVSTLNQTTSQRSVGIQLNVPLFSGGAVEAGVAQSRAERERAEQELRGERENLTLEVERLYRAVSGGRERLTAHLRALDSAAVAVRASSRAFETGLGTATELRDALLGQARARRDLIQARYEYLNQRTQLMVVSGWDGPLLMDELTRSLTVHLVVKDLP